MLVNSNALLKNMVDIASNSVAAAKALLPRLLEGITGEARKTVAGWNLENALSRLFRTRYVKPIWNPGTETDLHEFYYPCPVETEGHEHTVSALTDFPGDHVLITGRVGQGKSMLLRFIASNELLSCLSGNNTARIPLFIELRHIGQTRGLREFAIDSLCELGLQCDPALFDQLAKHDRVALLLDGLDELPLTRRGNAVNELERLGTRYPEMKIALTSRPNVSGIEHIAGYSLAKLVDLDQATLEGVIRKQYSSDQQAMASALLDAIATHEVRELSTTPLMAVLLVIHFNTYQKIPQKADSFHEDLFDALLRRHDATKPGFVRPRLSKLDDFGMRSWFDRCAFYCMKSGTSSWNRRTMLDIASRALPARGQAAGAEDVLTDAVQITGLLADEGGHYEFIHKSVAEYHAASCVKSLSEVNARRFYRDVRSSSRWRWWEEVLRFLSVIDRLRYLRYFEISQLRELIDNPSLNTLLASCRVSFSSDTRKLSIANSWLLDAAGARTARLVSAFEAFLKPHAATLVYAVSGEAMISKDHLASAEEEQRVAGALESIITWCGQALLTRQAEVDDLDDADELLDLGDDTSQ